MNALEFHVHPARWIACKVGGWISPKAYLRWPSGLRLVDRPIPDLPGPNWVRLRTILGGICGTDLGLISLRNHPATILERFSSFPAVLGHENLAAIDAVGPGVRNWRVGQRVCVEPAVGCAGRDATPVCAACAAGRASNCAHPGDDRLPPRALLGLNHLTGGSWAGYFSAHASQLHAVPDRRSDDVAILTDPLASALHAVLRRPPVDSDHVLISGSGIIALGLLAGIRALGSKATVTCVARHPFQADLARLLGATNVTIHRRGLSNAERYDDLAKFVGGRRIPARFGNRTMLGGFDLVFDCTGTGRGLTDALKWTRAGGAVVAVGTSSITWLDSTPLWFDEISLIGANGRQIETVDGVRRHTYDFVLDWLASGRLNAAPLRVTRFPLTDYRRAFQSLFSRGRHGIIKAVFEPSNAPRP